MEINYEIVDQKTTPDHSAPSNGKIKILENVQICTPLANSDFDFEIFKRPENKKNEPLSCVTAKLLKYI